VPTGWLLDITDSRPGTGVVLWLKEAGTGRIEARRLPWRPPFLVDGPAPLLAQVERALADDPAVERIERRVERPSLFDRRPRRLLAVTPRTNRARRRLAAAVDARGDYHALTLYDVDLAAPQLYHLAHGLYPFAPVDWDGAGVRATEPAETIDYAPVPLHWVPLEVHFAGVRRRALVPPGTPIEAVQLGAIRVKGADEADTLRSLVEELRIQEPDLLLTDGGDALDLPRLYERADALGLDETAFFLGREPGSFRPSRPAGTFASYGRLHHRDAAFPLPGRFHIDGADSFLYGDASIEGMIDAARLSRLSLQTVARQSPGSCFTAMEMAHALAGGHHVPWKKNRPEGFQPLRRLLEADRGGVIFQPPVGAHSAVDEFDFSSLYPNIMVRHNLSTETLDCRCCPESPHVAPGLGFRSCVRRVGLIPRTIAPLVARRAALKARVRDPATAPAERARAERRVKMLKWILVTSFGYQGYRNARFGRIECHEAINAYARELIARLIPRSEAAGYRVLHGIVDSLWLAPVAREPPPDPEAFARAVSEELELPLAYEGRFRWIVFLPAVGHGLGVPNRYYGCYGSGELKKRGIRSRRGDTPILLAKAEAAVLELFAKAPDAEALAASVPAAVERLDAIAAVVRDGGWPAEELLITRRLAREPADYQVFNETVAAVRQLAALGAERAAGQSVRFVVRDRAARSFRDRVTVAERLPEDGRYDPVAYVELLARGADTLLSPLGYPYEVLARRWGVDGARGRSSGPARPRSPERLAQRTLDAPPGRGLRAAPPARSGR
jgi:DNA polymerase elongation subunit (family B)